MEQRWLVVEAVRHSAHFLSRATACMLWIVTPTAPLECAFPRGDVFVKHLVIYSVNSLSYFSEHWESWASLGPTHPVSHASGSHSIAQIKWLPANQLWKSFWCTLHLFTTLPKFPALVFSPRQLFKNPNGKKKMLIKCRLCLLPIPASVNWSCIQDAFLGSPVALYGMEQGQSKTDLQDAASLRPSQAV